jgi:hypothetical protein
MGRSTVEAPVPAQWVPRLALLLSLALAVWVGTLSLHPPAPPSAAAPPADFSATRTIPHLAAIARESRAIGTPGHATARQYLLDQLRALGLEPEVQVASANLRFSGADYFRAGTVTNLMARIPGTASTGTIALNAHYDSGPTGPGASDCGSCVVTVLETVRAILAGPALRNDVLVVFTDAEEEGDLGAVAFNREHPWASDVRVAINYEAQGTSGPALLYATGSGNGWLVNEFLRVAPAPAAASLGPELTRLLGGQRLACDLQDYLDRGAAGLGFVYVQDAFHYHTVLDNVANTSLNSIQQEGANTLALVRHLGDLDLAATPSTGDRVFINLLPNLVLHYPQAWVVPLAALLSALTVALLTIGLRRRRLTGRGLLAGTLAYILGTLASVAFAEAIWIAVRAANPSYQVSLVGNYQMYLYVTALPLAALAFMAGLYALLGRTRPLNLVAGALLGGAILQWPLSLIMPGASYLAFWPLLLALLPLALDLLAPRQAGQPWVRAAALAIAAVPGLLLLPITLYLMVALLARVELIGTPTLGLAALFVAPLAGLLLPHLDFLTGGRRWRAAAVLAAAALALIVWGTAASGYSPAQPRPSRLAYELDADAGSARWVSPDARLDHWTRQFIPAAEPTGTFEVTLGTSGPAFVGPAPRLELAPPEVVVESEAVQGDERRLRLRLLSPRGAPRLEVLVVAQGEIVSAQLDGRPLDLAGYEPAAQGRLLVSYAGVPEGGVELELSVRSAGPLTITLRDTSDGLPDLDIVPRPEDTMPAPGFPRDPTMVRRTQDI